MTRLHAMDDQRIGAAFRAFRLKRGLRQSDVGRVARVHKSVVSLIERGHLERVSTAAFRRVARGLEIRADIRLTLPHGEIDRILNQGHAALHESMARYLRALPGWVHAPEVSFAVYGERGVIDVFAFHEPTQSLLVIELKTEFVSLEDLLTTMDIRLRHAAELARQRGWRARTTSAWVVFAESDTNRRELLPTRRCSSRRSRRTVERCTRGCARPSAPSARSRFGLRLIMPPLRAYALAVAECASRDEGPPRRYY